MYRLLIILIGGLFSAWAVSMCRIISQETGHRQDRRSKRTRLTRLRDQAVAGNAGKQLHLGVMCAAGVDGWADYRKALFWFRKAAEQGEPNAQMLLAMMYLEGQGGRRSYKEAARWAKLSALQGNVIAQLVMGALLEDGAGMRRDYERAVYWYRKAADYPVEFGARQRLGILYLEGKGVEKNTGEAIKWLQASADKGDANACFQLGMLYYDGRLVEQDYTEALKWYLKAAESEKDKQYKNSGEIVFGSAAVKGEVYTQTVGQIMQRNPHVVRNAQFYVGMMHETGRGTEKNMDLSREWYLKAAEAGDEIARQRLVFLKEFV